MSSSAIMSPANRNKPSLLSKVLSTLGKGSAKKSKLRPLVLPTQLAEKKTKQVKPNLWSRMKDSIKSKFTKRKPTIEASSAASSSPTVSEADSVCFSVEAPVPLINEAKPGPETLLELNSALKQLEDLIGSWDIESCSDDSIPSGELSNLDESTSTEELSSSSDESDELPTPKGSPIVGELDLPPVPKEIIISVCADEEVQDINFGSEIIRGPISPAWFAVKDMDFLEVPSGSSPVPRAEPEWDFTNISHARGRRFAPGHNSALGRFRKPRRPLSGVWA